MLGRVASVVLVAAGLLAAKPTNAQPVDPARMLVAELEEGAFDGVTGTVLPDWDA